MLEKMVDCIDGLPIVTEIGICPVVRKLALSCICIISCVWVVRMLYKLERTTPCRQHKFGLLSY